MLRAAPAYLFCVAIELIFPVSPAILASMRAGALLAAHLHQRSCIFPQRTSARSSILSDEVGRVICTDLCRSRSLCNWRLTSLRMHHAGQSRQLHHDARKRTSAASDNVDAHFEHSCILNIAKAFGSDGPLGSDCDRMPGARLLGHTSPCAGIAQSLNRCVASLPPRRPSSQPRLPSPLQPRPARMHTHLLK